MQDALAGSRFAPDYVAERADYFQSRTVVQPARYSTHETFISSCRSMTRRGPKRPFCPLPRQFLYEGGAIREIPHCSSRRLILKLVCFTTSSTYLLQDTNFCPQTDVLVPEKNIELWNDLRATIESFNGFQTKAADWLAGAVKVPLVLFPVSKSCF
jgi:hypothetical protein